MPTLEEKRKEEALEALVSQFPAHYKVRGTKYLKGLLDALAEGDGFVSTQIEAVRDNLLVLTASGKNLDRLASQYGVVRGQGTGVQDDDFRRLIPIMGMSPKQITHSIQRVIDAIYGPYASHANVTCSSPAPYHISPGTSLKVRVDDKVLEIFFAESDFINNTAATALEVATAISEKTAGRIVGSVVLNTQTGEEFLNVRTSTIGSQGFIQVLGGDAQGAFRFPQIRNTRQELATWTVSRYQGTDEMVYTATAGISPGCLSGGVKRGDIVTIRMDSGFDPANTGSFEVTYAEDDVFRVRNGRGVPEVGVAQVNVDDFTFYRPDLGNILLAARPATVLETGNRELTVLLPVTSPIVKRKLAGGHHFHMGVAVSTAATVNTMTISTIAEFPTTGELHIISSRPHNTGTISSTSPGVIRLIDSEGWPDRGAVYSPTTQTFYYYEGKDGRNLLNVTPTPPAELAGAPVKYSERFKYDGIVGQVLQNVFPDPRGVIGKEIAVAGAELFPDFQGSFMFDPFAPFICSEVATRLNELVAQGSSRTVIQVQGTTGMPEKGYFVLEYGTDHEEGPIRYLGRVGNTALIIDPGHVFRFDHLKGVSLRVVRQIGPYVPRVNGEDLAVYMTSTSPARDLVAAYIRDIVAAGVTVKFNISVPEQKWPILQQLYASDPLATELT